MEIGVKTPGIHHLTLRSANLQRSRQFYVDVLGFPIQLEKPNLFIVAAGSTAVVVVGPMPRRPPQMSSTLSGWGWTTWRWAARTSLSSKESLQR